MSEHCYLSIAGVSLLLETDHPLIQNNSFAPFLIEPISADIHARFYKVAELPSVPDRVLFADECCRIGMDGQGNLQKFFFEIPEDPIHYAVSTYDHSHARIRVEYLESYSHCVSEIRNCFYLLGFESILLRRNKICLHASCVETPLGGLLFSGVSGIGKSTQADLWCKYREARQINGDRPILSKELSGWRAWGSPYAGSSRCYVNDSCDISAIIMLKKAPVCSLRRLHPSEAFRAIWAGLTVHSWETAFVEKASALTIDLISTIPVYEFSCTPDELAVNYLEQALRKETSL